VSRLNSELALYVNKQTFYGISDNLSTIMALTEHLFGQIFGFQLLRYGGTDVIKNYINWHHFTDYLFYLIEISKLYSDCNWL